MTSHVVYNGATGGLGRHLGAALADQSLSAWPVHSRLGDTTGLTEELDRLPIEPGSSLTFIQSAGMVSIIECEENPAETYDVNVLRTTVTVETFVKWAIANGNTPSILFISSGHVYAPPPHGKRLDESSPVEPRSVYAKTELEGENRMRTVAAEHDLGLAICRVFGMIGPDQRHHYLLPGLIRRIRAGDLAEVPGLDYVRDFLDTRDVSRLLATLTADLFADDDERRVTLVNVCSGEEIRIGELLDELLALFYRDDPRAAQGTRSAVSVAPGRPTDIPWSVGDPLLLSQLVGGAIRSIPIVDTLADALAAG
jgi:nucleoside-diphosphate-sugar epimerase